MPKVLDRTHLRQSPTPALIELATSTHPASNCFDEIAVAVAERLAEYSAAVIEAKAVISKSPGRAASILQQLK